MAAERTATVSRETKETKIEVKLALDGTGNVEAETGIGFLDHMLGALGFHARWDVSISCDGDLEVDDHHTVEDTALALGTAVSEALGDRRGIVRFASAYAPLDEALCRAVVDVSGRPYCEAHMGLKRERVGELSCENVPHFFHSFAQTAGITLHLDVLRGVNDHHRIEAAKRDLHVLAASKGPRKGDHARRIVDDQILGPAPGDESPPNAVDRTLDKYLNFGELNSGFIVSPLNGARPVSR